MKVDGRTRVVAIFGDPISHTLSPAMQNAAFEALGLNAVYLPFHVSSTDKGALKAAAEAVRSMGLIGANVTIPHKERVIRYLDEVDEHAFAMGAVNTIVNSGGRLVGYNTDGAGYLLSLRSDTGFRPGGKRVVIIGAGGAARSIFYSILGLSPRSVVIANRTVKRGLALAKEFKARAAGVEVDVVSLDRDAVARHLKAADLVVNTTSIGMMGKGELDIPVELLSEKAVVSDIVYRPLRTGLLKAASRRGLRIHGGLGMLVRQGAIGFELWTGKRAPYKVMERAAMRALKPR